MTKAPSPKLFMLMAAGALVVGGGLCYMGYGNLGAQEASLQKLKAESKDAATLAKMLDESKLAVNDSTVKLQHLEESVPEFAYVPTMMQELEKVGKNAGIDVIGVRPLPAPAPTKKEDGTEGGKSKRKAFQAVDIEVKGRGKYRSVMNFVAALGTFPKIVSARAVDMTPKADPGVVSTVLEVTIQLRAYVFEPPVQNSTSSRTAMNEGGNHAG